MTGALTTRGHRTRTQREDRVKTRREERAIHKPGTTDPSLAARRRDQPCGHPDFCALPPGALRQTVSAVSVAGSRCCVRQVWPATRRPPNTRARFGTHGSDECSISRDLLSVFSSFTTETSFVLTKRRGDDTDRHRQHLPLTSVWIVPTKDNGGRTTV